MHKQVTPLTNCDAKRFGSKAYTLGKLIGEFNIPAGFALSTEFYESFLSENNFPFSEGEYYARNREIKEFIRTHELSVRQMDDIRHMVNNSGMLASGKKYAVRSSAICEDQKDASMAGIFESYIAIPNVEGIVSSIKECYCSMFEERTLEYFENNELELTALKMSVIVQEYIEGIISGVIFTADTNTHDAGIMFINFAKGKCSDFVDSKNESFYLKIEKSFGEVVESNQPAFGENHLPDIIILKLFETALSVEKKLGYPSDIEWTYDGENIFILQARPITTLKYEKIVYEPTEEDKRYHWFLAEQYPIKTLLEDHHRSSFSYREKGIRRTGYGMQHAVLKQLAGYMYIGVGGLENEDELRARALARLKELTDSNTGIFHDILLPEIVSMKERLDGYIHRSLDCGETADFLHVARMYSQYIDSAHWDSVLGEEYLNEFRRYVESIRPNTSTEELYDLVYKTTVKTAERELLFRMSDYCKANPDCVNILASSVYPKIAYERLRISEYWIGMQELLNEYFNKFGMMIAGKRNNPANTLWEKPQYIIEKINAAVSQESEVFRENILTIQGKKGELKNQILAALPEGEKRYFLEKLTLAEKTFASIDDHHYYCEDMSWGYVKMAISISAKKLVVMNKLENEEDIYFLKYDEIEALLRNDIKEVDVCSRKELYEAQSKMIPPQPLFMVEKQDSSELSAKSDDKIENKKSEVVTVLKGMSSLNKSARGKIKLGYGNPDEIEEGCILVVNNGHGNDLFPLMGKLAGIIVTGGSPFDHMGIITREMNIPALYYVKNAFDVLKEGDIVILDGGAGTLSVL